MREYRTARRRERMAYSKEYDLLHRERRHARYAENRDKIKEQVRVWQGEHSELWKEIRRNFSKLRRARKRGVACEPIKPLPGVAPVAMQEGTWVAKQIKADLAGKAREPFHYFDKGSLATIGRAAAIAQFGKVHISGFLAWLTWLFVHIMFLIGFRNRIMVMLQWAWSYLTYERAAWLITGATRVVTVPSMEYAERARMSHDVPAEDAEVVEPVNKRSA